MGGRRKRSCDVVMCNGANVGSYWFIGILDYLLNICVLAPPLLPGPVKNLL